MSDTGQMVVGLVAALGVVALICAAAFVLEQGQQRRIDRLNAEEERKHNLWEMEHELDLLPCSDPHCSACVYGGTYLPPLRMEWVLR